MSKVDEFSVARMSSENFTKKLNSYSWNKNDTEPKYSIEPHGKEGNYVLYYGRDMYHHGLNLCTLSDFDKNESDTIKKICDALNDYKK